MFDKKQTENAGFISPKNWIYFLSDEQKELKKLIQFILKPEPFYNSNSILDSFLSLTLKSRNQADEYSSFLLFSLKDKIFRWTLPLKTLVGGLYTTNTSKKCAK